MALHLSCSENFLQWEHHNLSQESVFMLNYPVTKLFLASISTSSLQQIKLITSCPIPSGHREQLITVFLEQVFKYRKTFHVPRQSSLQTKGAQLVKPLPAGDARCSGCPLLISFHHSWICCSRWTQCSAVAAGVEKLPPVCYT